MASPNAGIQNEHDFAHALDSKKVTDLNNVLQNFVKELCPGIAPDTVIHAAKHRANGYKPDVCVTIDSSDWGISLKKGSGNSVHQEKTDFFLNYCTKELGMTEKEKEAMLLFLYGDGTTDGDSTKEERLTTEEVNTHFKEEIKIVQNFFDKNKVALIERFLVYGKSGRERGIKADYIYHGTPENGDWIQLSTQTIHSIAKLTESNGASLYIGPFTFQVWNRNLDAKPELEDRRHSIQIKWPKCETHIKHLHGLESERRKSNNNFSLRQRTIGNNQHGFQNRSELGNALNGKKVKDLPGHLKNLVNDMFKNPSQNSIVYAKDAYVPGFKPKLAVSIGSETHFMSVSMGSGNGVHQEKAKSFIQFCVEELGMSQQLKKAYMLIHYGDGTTDGKGDIDSRLGNAEIKKEYADEIRLVQAFFDQHRVALAQRFLMFGKSGLEEDLYSEYFYYGTPENGTYASMNDIVGYIQRYTESSSAVLSIGPLSLQTWNRMLGSDDSKTHKRDDIQVKWAGIKKTLEQIKALREDSAGTASGTWSEYDLVYTLNKNKQQSDKMWKLLMKQLGLTSNEDVYAVRVTGPVRSSLSERKVLPKADLYLVKGNIPHEDLLECNYWLEEENVDFNRVCAIPLSGISCKKPDSESFTYIKLTVASYSRLFNDKLHGCGAMIFVKGSDISHNTDILKAWGYTPEAFVKEYNEKHKLEGLTMETLDTPEMCKRIKQASVKFIENEIRTDKKICNAVFKGEGLFDEPYTAQFIFHGGQMESNDMLPDFSITTGSGRHKGTYTLVVKPK